MIFDCFEIIRHPKSAAERAMCTTNLAQNGRSDTFTTAKVLNYFYLAKFYVHFFIFFQIMLIFLEFQAIIGVFLVPLRHVFKFNPGYARKMEKI